MTQVTSQIMPKAQRRKVVVDSVENISPTVYVVTMSPLEGGKIEFIAGQFISIFAEKEGRKISRPYSIGSPPYQNDLEFIIKVVEGGFMSNFLHHVESGTELDVLGPLGRFILPHPLQEDLIFVSTGTGI